MYGRTAIKLAYFVPPSPHFAGVERVVHEIASGLAERHNDLFDVHVIFATKYDEAVLKNVGYRLHVLDVDRLRSVSRPLRAILKAEQIEMLVTAQVEPSVVAWLATRRLHLPWFLTHLHGNPHVEELRGSLATRVSFALFRNLISRNVAAVLAVSPSLRDYAAAHVTKHAPVLYAKNPAREQPNELGERIDGAGTIRLLNVARLSYQKGIDVLLKALKLALPDLPAVSLTIVGSGPDEMALRALCTNLDLDHVVRFAGYQPDPAIFFQSADLFVLSSRWEGFPLVLLEALRFGLPLLSTDCQFGPGDLIDAPWVGQLVRVDDVESLAAGLISSCQTKFDDTDVERRQQLASSYGRASASDMHSEVLSSIVGRKANMPFIENGHA